MKHYCNLYLYKVLFIVVLLVQSFTFAQVSSEEEKIKAHFNVALFDTLHSLISTNQTVTKEVISASSNVKLAKEYSTMIKRGAYNQQKLDSLKNIYTTLIQKNAVNYTRPDSSSVLNTEILLMRLLKETSSTSDNSLDKFRYNPLSDYRFLVGGSWTHSENDSGLSGVFTAEMFVRTRWWDQRAINIENINNGDYLKNERGFLDLLVDAKFITNQPFNNIDSSSNPDIKKFLLESVRSSSLSMGLFFAPPFWGKLFDQASFGFFLEFEISTKSFSADVFRRFIYGLRIENRSYDILNGANIQIGLTRNKTPGSMETDSGKLFGLGRIALNMELPLTDNIRRWGLYVQFNGEWPTFWNNEGENLPGTNIQGSVNPPVYQFRLGATFDPIKIFGPIFGLGTLSQKGG